jgi:hypothetical protein
MDIVSSISSSSGGSDIGGIGDCGSGGCFYYCLCYDDGGGGGSNINNTYCNVKFVVYNYRDLLTVKEPYQLQTLFSSE